MFSTGSYIDSLAINVKVKDALEKKGDAFVSVMLYEVNENNPGARAHGETGRRDANGRSKTDSNRGGRQMR